MTTELGDCDYDGCCDTATRHFMGNYYCNFHNKMIRDAETHEELQEMIDNE